MAFAIGLNSGSSFDGVDAVLIEIGEDGLGRADSPKFIDGISIDWPEAAGLQVKSAFENQLSIFELTRLNYVCGAVFAQAAVEIMRKHGLSGEDIDVIGYDGQTIYQEPPEPEKIKTYDCKEPYWKMWTDYGFACGLQIGEPGVVAVLADVPVVTQFRSVDHTLGGTGAPLMQYLDYVLFRDAEPTLTLNIGGISNIQFAAKDRKLMKAFDCGPGNVMIDHAMMRLFGKEFDADGKTAASGQVNSQMLRELMAHPFFKRPIPRCAWRLDFGAEYCDSFIDRYHEISPEDIVATLTAFTAEAIGNAISENIAIPQDGINVYTSGGGAKNSALLDMIRQRLPHGANMQLSDAIGIPLQYKEAVKFATIAYSTKRSIADNIPAASGAHQFGVLGKLVLPPRLARFTDE